MNKLFSSIVISILLISFTFLITGCGDKEQKDGQTIISMWVMPNSLEPVNDLADILEDFHKANPDIKVQLTSLDWGSAWQRITIATMSGEGPDILQLGTTWVGAVTGMGALADLTTKVNDLGGASYFLPSSWRYSGIDGSNVVTSIPWFVDARAMYYRTDVFNRLGLSKNDLATWESFQKTLDKIHKANLTIDGKRVYPLGITGKNDWNVVHNLAPWIWMAGGDFLKENNKECALYSKEAANGLSFLVNLVIKGYVPESCLEQNTSQVENAFNNGEYAIIFTGSNELRALVTPEEQGGAANTYVAKRFDIAPYPEGPKGKVTFVGGSNLSIFKNSKNKDEAWEVIKYLVGKKAQVEYSKRSGFLPSAIEAFDDPYFTQDSRRAVYREAVKYGRAYPCIPEWAQIEQPLNRRFGIMWEHVLSNKDKFSYDVIYEDVLKKATIEVDKVLLMNR
ncbi:MAG: sugar ABC transporter substrate-binding protein [Candidatus Margulisbacteria bacterium]|nr:sugar ABC transporter substrate-binding protein [Candidatus Margulisiibacteriota bacterium]